MRDLEVLLRDHVEHLGRCGEVVRVRPGYARNYLFPRRLAVEANEEKKHPMPRRRTRLDLEEKEREQWIEARLSALADVELRTSAKADEQGRLYGSVSGAQLVTLLSRAGFEFEERDIRLEAPIKTLGSHLVPVHVAGERSASVRLEVERED
jgi:large subunit ribosomal protein L9